MATSSFPIIGFAVGVEVFYDGEPYRIEAIKGLDSLDLVNQRTGKHVLASPRDVESSEAAVYEDARRISDAEAALALTRFPKLEPFIERECTAADIINLGRELGLHRAQLYDLIRKVRGTSSPAAVIRGKRGTRPGTKRLDPRVEKIIATQTKSAQRSGRTMNINSIMGEIETDCVDAGLKPPVVKTVRRRIEEICRELPLRKKFGVRRARERTRALPGTIATSAPLAMVEVDHSPLDIFLVDSADRKPIGRANLTLVSDTFSRAVLGFHLGLDAPGALPVALALTHAVMPKQEWLAERGLGDLEWPMCGVPRHLRVDRASEFRSPKFESSCGRWGIKVNPRKKKEDGGIGERIIGTIQNWASQEPGASGNDPKKLRGEQDRQEKAEMTLAEAECWLARQLMMKYHCKRHSNLGMSPNQAWRAWHLAEGGETLPVLVADKNNFLVSFLPSETRVINPDGIRLFREKYFCNELRPYVKPSLKRKLHYDPRKLGLIYVDVGTTKPVEVRYADLTKPCLPKFEEDERARKQRARYPDEFNREKRVALVKENRKARRASKRATRAARRKERLAQSAKLQPQSEAITRQQGPTKSLPPIDYGDLPVVSEGGPV